MYLEFYDLKALPFNITPDPRYLFFSRHHREAFEHIVFGITQKKGFIQITGEVGAGKSTLCRAVLEELDEGYSTALILNPVMTAIQLIRTILRELGLDDRGNDRVRLTDRLNTFLLERAHAEEEVVLLIDEAQDMSPDLLEQVRLLSNLETDDQKLLQIVLVGQPELKSMLSGDSLRQLSQRITVRYHLDPIRRDEVEAYILHRLQVAGSNGRPSFTTAAYRAIHRHSRGVPRLINAVCDKALLCGYVEGRDRLGYWQIRRAIRELGGNAR
jgi:general secretion pathway protein A